MFFILSYLTPVSEAICGKIEAFLLKYVSQQRLKALTDMNCFRNSTILFSQNFFVFYIALR